MTTPYPDDRIETQMKDAMDELRRLKIPFSRRNAHQLKFGPVNYYPTKGTIHVDEERTKRKEVGLAALLAVLEEFGLYKPGPKTHRCISEEERQDFDNTLVRDQPLFMTINI